VNKFITKITKVLVSDFNTLNNYVVISFNKEITSSAPHHMTVDPDHGFGLLSSEDQEKLELILDEHSAGLYGVADLHGMLTASVIGPKPIPLDWILQAVLSLPGAEASEFDHFPEFCWASEKIEELFLRISRVFQQDHEMFRPLFSQPELQEWDTTPDPRPWCLGFVQAVMYQPEEWEPLLSTKWGILTVAPIFMTVDPDQWAANDDLNPFKGMSPSKLCEAVKISARVIHAFWPVSNKYRKPIRVSVTPGRNDPCPCGSGRKFKRCCRRPV
jgi:uncharacterized protein